MNEVCLSKVWWPGKGKIVSGNYTMIYSGGVKFEKGVAVVLRNDNVKSLTKVECYSDKLMFVKIGVKLVDTVLVQVYMQTTNHDDNEIEKLYEEISEVK